MCLTALFISGFQLRLDTSGPLYTIVWAAYLHNVHRNTRYCEDGGTYLYTVSDTASELRHCVLDAPA